MILIDKRAGSEELICHPPFSICPVCGAGLKIERKSGSENGIRKRTSVSHFAGRKIESGSGKETRKPKQKPGGIVSARCSVNQKHRTLAMLVDLTKSAVACPEDDKSNSTTLQRTSADVEFSGNGPDGKVRIGVEVKSLADLLTSIRDGRLRATQIPALLRYDVPWLAYYGEYRTDPKTGHLQVPYWHQKYHRWLWRDYKLGSKPVETSYLERFLCSPSLTSTKLRTVGFSTVEALAYWLGVSLYGTWQKDYHKHRSMFAFDQSGGIPGSHLLPQIHPVAYQIMQTAASLPGIGFERAQAVADQFGSILEMINATETQWSNVAVVSRGTGRVVKLGPTRAKAIVRAIVQEKKEDPANARRIRV
jgi:hypothetical protein